MKYLIFLFLLTIISCTQYQGSIELEESFANAHEQINLKIADTEQTLNVWHGESSQNPDLNYRLAIITNRYSSEDFKSLIDHLNLPVLGNNIIGYVIYSNRFYLNNEAFDTTSIYGVLIHYTDNDNYLNSSYFSIEKGKAKEIEELTSKTKDIAFDDIFSLYQLFSEGRKTSAIVLFNKSLQYKKSFLTGRYDKKINKYSGKKKLILLPDLQKIVIVHVAFHVTPLS